MNQNWLTEAKNRPLNGKTDIECPENCGSGTKLSVNHSIGSYWCNCYRCGFTDSEPVDYNNLKSISALRELNNNAVDEVLPLTLPEDFTNDIPVRGRIWLHKCGLLVSEWEKYNIGFSPRLQRVILPVYDKNKNLIWYQCRAIHIGQQPKYIQPSANRNNVAFYSSFEDSKRIVLTEDIMSAIIVGRVAKACSLLGTKLPDGISSDIINYDLVTTWLDSDRAGTTGAYNIKKKLSCVTSVNNICTKDDPKLQLGARVKDIISQTTDGSNYKE